MKFAWYELALIVCAVALLMSYLAYLALVFLSFVPALERAFQ